MPVCNCEACGRFAQYPRDFEADQVCVRCEHDPRPGVRERRREIVERFERQREGVRHGG